MEKLKFGETAVLENGKEYVVFGTVEENDKEYVYLVTTSKPLEVRFATQQIIDDELILKIVEDQEEKEHLLEIFQSQRKDKQE